MSLGPKEEAVVRCVAACDGGGCGAVTAEAAASMKLRARGVVLRMQRE